MSDLKEPLKEPEKRFCLQCGKEFLGMDMDELCPECALEAQRDINEIAQHEMGFDHLE